MAIDLEPKTSDKEITLGITGVTILSAEDVGKIDPELMREIAGSTRFPIWTKTPVEGTRGQVVCIDNDGQLMPKGVSAGEERVSIVPVLQISNGRECGLTPGTEIYIDDKRPGADGQPVPFIAIDEERAIRLEPIGEHFFRRYPEANENVWFFDYSTQNQYEWSNLKYVVEREYALEAGILTKDQLDKPELALEEDR